MKTYILLTKLLVVRLLYIFVIASLVFSCIPRKNYILLQNKTTPPPDSVTLKVIKETYKVRPGDVLYVRVLSLDEEAVKIFNIESQTQRGQGGGASSAAGVGALGYMSGYTLDDEGRIRMPMIGHIYVQGLSLLQIDSLLEKKLSIYLKDVIVKVRLLSFKITVMGEVGSQGTQTVQAERYTILEAIGAAGGIGDFGNRKKIELMRATTDGYIVYNIDMTDQSIVQSKNFFMAPNDVLYVRPITAKMVRLNYPVYGYITTGISAILLTISLLSRFSQ